MPITAQHTGAWAERAMARTMVNFGSAVPGNGPASIGRRAGSKHKKKGVALFRNGKQLCPVRD